MSEKQKAISDLLRSADKVIKSGRLEEAMRYINKVFELDYKNIYAKAYRERIISLLEGSGVSKEEAERIAAQAKFLDKTEPAKTTTQERKKEESLSLKEEAERIVAQSTTPTKVEGKKDEPVSSKKEEAKAEPPVTSKNDSKKEEVTAPQEEPIGQKSEEKVQQSIKATPPSPPQQKIDIKTGSEKHVSQIKRSEAAVEAYKTLLMEIWKDGDISSEEQVRIDSMRDTFAIAQNEHVQIENDVRVASYLSAIQTEWRKGGTNFEALRKKFNINDQEHLAIEPKLFQLLQSLQANGSVLLLDDDESFLDVIKGVLGDSGYYCFAATSGEEGLELLETLTPDIVVCDINFAKPNMSGFAFYEKFRSMDKFLMTPFIFLTALDQEVLIRTGKKLGVDDYLTKPMDTEMLLATIEGKMRRFRELRRSLDV
ncbi:MAG: response regulator [Bacteroidota bacterium]|nr:response regulator [Bacteroidota bacterium]